MDLKLKKIPQRIKEKILRIIKCLSENSDYRIYQGKRIKRNRNLISVPVNKQYRIVFKIIETRLVPIFASTHNKYNHFIKSYQGGMHA